MNQIFTHITYTNPSDIDTGSVVHISGESSETFELSYDELTESQKQKVDDFMQLIILLTPIK